MNRIVIGNVDIPNGPLSSSNDRREKSVNDSLKEITRKHTDGISRLSEKENSFGGNRKYE